MYIIIYFGLFSYPEGRNQLCIVRSTARPVLIDCVCGGWLFVDNYKLFSFNPKLL
jgi:hypothetical protein